MPRANSASRGRDGVQGNEELTSASIPAEFQAGKPAGWRRKLMVAIRALVAVAIFGFIFHSVNFASIVAPLSAATAWAFTAGVIILLGQMALCTARWRLLVEPAGSRPGFADSYLAFVEGHFFNQVLPTTVGGDAWRVVRWRAAGVSLRAAAASVLMDRVSGAMGAAILAIVASALLSHFGLGARLTLSILLLGTMIAGGIVVFIFAIRWRGLPLRRFPRIANLRGSLVLDWRYFASLGYSIAGHCVCGIAVYAAARSLGIDLPLVLIVSVTAAVLLVLMIPISLGGWGIREASFITLLVPFGVNSQNALLIGILFGLMNLVSSLPGGLSFLADRKAAYRNTDRTMPLS